MDELVEHCLAAGVGVFPDSPYHLLERESAGLILGFARLTPEEIREGTHELGRVLAKTNTRRTR